MTHIHLDIYTSTKRSRKVVPISQQAGRQGVESTVAEATLPARTNHPRLLVLEESVEAGIMLAQRLNGQTPTYTTHARPEWTKPVQPSASNNFGILAQR